MRNFAAESQLKVNPVLSMAGINVWKIVRPATEISSRPPTRITSYGVEVPGCAKILVQEQDGEEWLGLFIGWSRDRKRHQRKLLLRPIDGPRLETSEIKTEKVKPNGIRRCFIV